MVKMASPGSFGFFTHRQRFLVTGLRESCLLGLHRSSELHELWIGWSTRDLKPIKEVLFPRVQSQTLVYHIRDEPVPADGNCTKTPGRLDSFARSKLQPCNAAEPHQCQVGDSRGKDGDVTRGPFEVEYVDTFLSFKEDSRQYIGNRSLVL